MPDSNETQGESTEYAQTNIAGKEKERNHRKERVVYDAKTRKQETDAARTAA